MKRQIYIKVDTMANVQRKIQQQMHKRRYNGKCVKKDMIAIFTKEKYNDNLKNCKQGKTLRTINRKRIKHRFGLVLKPITNKYYINSIYYLFY